MANISTTIAGVRIQTPIGASSMAATNWWYPCTPMGKWIDWHKRCVDAGAGFVYLPTTSTLMRDEVPVRKNYLGQMARTGAKGDPGYVCASISSVYLHRDPSKRFCETLRKTLPAEVPIVGSVAVPGGDLEVYRQIAKELESAGANMLEINAGCPIDVSEKPGVKPEAGGKYGLLLGISPSILRSTVEAVVEAVKIPVGVKMTPQAGYPGLLVAAEAAIEAGARWLLTAHMPLAIGPFDIRNGGKPLYPLLKHVEANAVSGIGGSESIRMINHFHTACVAMFFPNTDVWSGGGIITGEHLVQSIMLGAKAGQTASGVLMRGISQINRIRRFLIRYMDEFGYKTIEDFRGSALRYIKPVDSALVEARGVAIAAKVDPTICIGCGTCAESICPAISMKDDVAEIHEDDCAACGVCIALCEQDAITMAPSKRTLGERIDAGKDYTTL